MKTIIRNACIVNEGNSIVADILISNKRIEKINRSINLADVGSIKEINAEGLYLLPGVIDDQVHFREPG
jgi:dihydroorotase